MDYSLYPLQFEPIYKEKIWGGNKLNSLLNKDCDKYQSIGESWEISGVDENISIVANGPLKGKTLNELCKAFKEDFVGKKVYEKHGDKFPLLIKFLDASDDLSVQVHPNDEMALAKHNSYGKSEMWYILSAEENAEIIYGFDESLTEDQIKELIKSNNYHSSLNKIKVKEGDSYYIEPGTVHAIGKGIVLAEIQQTSDITYRLWDFDRVGEDGSKRELHLESSFEAFKKNTVIMNHASDEKNQQLFSTPYFTTNKIKIEKTDSMRSYEEIDSFIIYIVVQGHLTIISEDSIEMQLKKGEVVLIPNSVRTVKFENAFNAEILECYLP